MLRLENLCTGYNGIERLHSLTADIRPGRLTAVIGPNGCGKSTLLKCIAGILPPSSGAMYLDGKRLSGLPGKDRAKHIAYMPQSRAVPEITVRQLAAHGRYPHLKWGQKMRASDHEIIESALERTGMLPFAHRHVSRLSGGERQKAYLAMMLAQQTPLMLLDEPTTYLDLSSQFELMELLGALCREGRSVLTVLHDLPLAMEYADDLLLMQDGCLIAAGSPETLCASGKVGEVFNVRSRRLEDGKFVFSPFREVRR